MIGSLSLRGNTEGIDHEPAADRYDVKVVKVVFQYEIRSFKDRERRKTQIAEPRGQEQTDAQDGELLLLACRRERPDRTTHHRDARAAWLTRKLYTELDIGDFSMLGVRKWLFLLVGAPSFELGPERIRRALAAFVHSPPK